VNLLKQATNKLAPKNEWGDMQISYRGYWLAVTDCSQGRDGWTARVEAGLNGGLALLQSEARKTYDTEFEAFTHSVRDMKRQISALSAGPGNGAPRTTSCFAINQAPRAHPASAGAPAATLAALMHACSLRGAPTSAVHRPWVEVAVARSVHTGVALPA